MQEIPLGIFHYIVLIGSLLVLSVCGEIFPGRFEHVPGLFLQGTPEQKITPRELNETQTENFGALKSWSEIHKTLGDLNGAKLMVFVRHAHGYHNLAESDAGYPDFKTQRMCTKCQYRMVNDDKHQLISIGDPDLTPEGQNQASSLNALLRADDADLWKKLTNDVEPLVVASPLSRTIQTANLALEGLRGKKMLVSDLAREMYDGCTYSARRSYSDEDESWEPSVGTPCFFKEGLNSRFSQDVNFTFMHHGQGFGLLSDDDQLFLSMNGTTETFSSIGKRAVDYLTSVFDNFPEEKIVVTFTHAWFLEYMLDVFGLNPYYVANTELIPILVRDRNVEENRGSFQNTDHSLRGRLTKENVLESAGIGVGSGLVIFVIFLVVSKLIRSRKEEAHPEEIEKLISDSA